MLKLTTLLQRQMNQGLRREWFERELAERVFTEWRDRYVTHLAALIRVTAEAKRLGTVLPRGDPTPEWATAAIHFLTVPDVSLQDYFLRASPDLKNELVAAVLQDGGMENSVGFFVELPPL